MSYLKQLRICSKIIEIYHESANKQHRWDRIFAISKHIRFYNSIFRQIWWMYYKAQHPLNKFFCCGTTIFLGGCCSHSKMSWSTASRNYQRLVFLKGNLDFLKWQRVAQRAYERGVQGVHRTRAQASGGPGSRGPEEFTLPHQVFLFRPPPSNFEWRPFFFALHLILGKKWVQIWVKTFFLLLA